MLNLCFSNSILTMQRHIGLMLKLEILGGDGHSKSIQIDTYAQEDMVLGYGNNNDQ